jgi:glycosyltransferase involved in cell wall biosynthesis
MKNKRMRILYLSRRFYPDLHGGLETDGYELVKTWRSLGHEVTVITENYREENIEEDEPIAGVRCIRISNPDRGRFWRIARGIRLGRWVWANWRYGRKTDITICIHPECVIGRKIAFPGRKTVFYCAGVFCPEPLSIQRVVDRWAWGCADRIALAGELNRQSVLAEGKMNANKLCVVGHGVDFCRFSTAVPAEVMVDLKRRGFFRVIYLGRLHEEKGVDLAIRAVFAMKNRDRVRLVLVGDGPMAAKLHGLVSELKMEEQVLFAGRTDSPERYLAGSDVLVLPSRVETHANVLMEAMAAGLACVSWRTDYPRVPVCGSEMILDGRTGFCVAGFDVVQMAGCLDRLVEDEVLRMNLGRNGQEHCRKTYSWPSMAESLIRAGL